MSPDEISRCTWPTSDPLYIDYHDTEWGVPEHDDRALFEKLILDGFQAGLSWITILRKRENFRRAFDGFEPEIIAGYGQEKVESLMADAGIVRNRGKIDGTINNAKGWLEIMSDGPGAFDRYLWGFTDGRTIQNSWRDLSEMPAATEESKAMSKALKGRGFKFVGPTICYAFMQAVGMVNDHTLGCFRYGQCRALK